MVHSGLRCCSRLAGWSDKFPGQMDLACADAGSFAGSFARRRSNTSESDTVEEMERVRLCSGSKGKLEFIRRLIVLDRYVRGLSAIRVEGRRRNWARGGFWRCPSRRQTSTRQSGDIDGIIIAHADGGRSRASLIIE